MIAQGHPQVRELESVLVARNDRLIWSVLHRYPRNIVSQEDLFLEGTMGLLKAARRFDPARNLKLTTFAVQWIRQHVGRAFEESGLIRVPSHAQEGLIQVRKAKDALGSGATAEQIASHTRLSLAKVRTILRGMEVGHFLSLDAPLIEDGSPLESILVEHAWPSAEESALSNLEREDLSDLIGGLPAREQEIMRMRFIEQVPLAQVGEQLGLSRERVRQLEVKALRHLKQTLKART